MYQRCVREQFDLGYFQLAARRILVIRQRVALLNRFFFIHLNRFFKACVNHFTILFTVETWMVAEDSVSHKTLPW